jgi:UDP-glucose 4-epimerase
VVPTVLGHDARLQFVHEDDCLDAMILATVEDVPGTYNVAGDGIMHLSQAIRRAGRPSLPIAAPLVPTVGRMFGRLGLTDLSPEQVRFLTWGRGIDTTRMRTRLGVEPRFTTVEAFDDFVRSRDLRTPLQADRAAELTASVWARLSGGERSA